MPVANGKANERQFTTETRRSRRTAIENCKVTIANFKLVRRKERRVCGTSLRLCEGRGRLDQPTGVSLRLFWAREKQANSGGECEPDANAFRLMYWACGVLTAPDNKHVLATSSRLPRVHRSGLLLRALRVSVVHPLWGFPPSSCRSRIEQRAKGSSPRRHGGHGEQPGIGTRMKKRHLLADW